MLCEKVLFLLLVWVEGIVLEENNDVIGVVLDEYFEEVWNWIFNKLYKFVFCCLYFV